MKRVFVLFLLVVCLGVGVAEAQIVRGHVHLYYSSCNPTLPYCANYSNSPVKLCAADGAGRPTNNCTTGMTAGSGHFSFDVGKGGGYYFFYFWIDDPYYFGSETYPRFKAFVAGSPAPYNEFGEIEVYPRTFPPTAVYPANGAHDVPAPAIILEWTAGIDGVRNNPSWPLTYDIYASGQEFPEIKVLSDVPCPTAWTTNRCSIPIYNLVHEIRYQWRVVSKLKSGALVPDAGLDYSYTTSSQTLRFSTTWNPASPPLNILAANGSYFKAPDGGGGAGTLAANGSGSNWETQFKLQDINGGTLNAGDSVCIYTNRAYYFTAYAGSGTVSANQQSCAAYETFAYEPVSGGVAFRSTWSNYYMSATNGGGGSVTVSATTVGPNETFHLQ